MFGGGADIRRGAYVRSHSYRRPSDIVGCITDVPLPCGRHLSSIGTNITYGPWTDRWDTGDPHWGRGLKPRSQHTKWTDLKSRPIVYAA